MGHVQGAQSCDTNWVQQPYTRRLLGSEGRMKFPIMKKLNQRVFMFY